jgi:hypothetical protein
VDAGPPVKTEPVESTEETELVKPVEQAELMDGASRAEKSERIEAEPVRGNLPRKESKSKRRPLVLATYRMPQNWPVILTPRRLRGKRMRPSLGLCIKFVAQKPILHRCHETLSQFQVLRLAVERSELGHGNQKYITIIAYSFVTIITKHLRNNLY